MSVGMERIEPRRSRSHSEATSPCVVREKFHHARLTVLRGLEPQRRLRASGTCLGVHGNDVEDPAVGNMI